MRNINDLPLAEVEAQLARYRAQRADNGARWADADVSDSALSDRANAAGIQMCETRIRLLRAGGHPFLVLVEIATGNVVALQPHYNTQWFKHEWRVKTAEGWRSFAFRPKRETTLSTKGYREEYRLLRATVTVNGMWNVLVKLDERVTLDEATKAPVVAPVAELA